VIHNHNHTYSGSNYYLVRTFGPREALGIFYVHDCDLNANGSLRGGVLKAVSVQLADSMAIPCMWFADPINRVDFETYREFGFTQYKTMGL